MGKGGCMDIWNMGTGMIRAVAGCLCCLLCGGPILILVGIVVLVAPNHFEEHRNEYKSAITTFKDTTLPVVERSSGGVMADDGVTSLQVASELVPITGVNMDKIESFTTHYLSTPQALPFQQDGSIRNVTNTNTTVLMAPVTVPAVSQSQITVQASPSCASKSDGCTLAKFQSWCDENYGGGESGAVLAVRHSKSHGECSFYERMEYFCKPLQLVSSTGAWELDSAMTGCDYLTGDVGTQSTSTGFTGQKYVVQQNSFSGENQYSIPVYLRASNDPYIVASRLTKGTFDFGLTAAQQRSIGLALIAVGSVLLLCVIGAAVLVYRMVHKDERSGQRVYGAFGRKYQHNEGSGYQQFPQQQAYPQQQGYAPQPGYPQQQAYPQQPPPQQAYPPQGYQQQQGYAPEGHKTV